MSKDNNNTPFKATLTLPQIIALYTGAVLGSGTLIIPGIAAEMAGPASLVAWGLMSILGLPMALTMGMLSAKYPDAGGVSHFVTKAFNAQAGSLTGWYFIMAVAIGAPVIALTGAGYLCTALELEGPYRIFIAALILFFSLAINFAGIKITGQVQIAVVLGIVAILVITISGGLTKIEAANFTPFAPSGWFNVASSTTVLFWCFLGWEAVSNISSEFKDPEKDAIRGTTIAAIVIGIIYFMTALVIVGTHSYGDNISDTSLVHIIKMTFGKSGAVLAGLAALFICIAPVVAYTGSVARLLYSQAEGGYAPKFFSRISPRYKTPSGGLIFIGICYFLLLAVFGTGTMSMTTLIQIPGTAFIITYICGCAAGVKLLSDRKRTFIMSSVSLALSLLVLLFVKWNIIYPLFITVLWGIYIVISKGSVKALWENRNGAMPSRGTESELS